MEVTVKKVKDTNVVQLVGKLDSNTAGQVQEKVSPLLDGGDHLTFDVSALEYISSAGLRVLLLFAKKLSARGDKVMMSGVSSQIKDIMVMTGFDHMFDFENSAA